jgi:hypothetical protein
VRFWDASALFVLAAGEPGTSEVRRLFEEDPFGVVWFFTAVEIRSALARRHRAGTIDAGTRDSIWGRFAALRPFLAEVDAVGQVRDRAHRLLDRHPLRAADALQLAAAIVTAEGRSTPPSLVTLDRRLAEAAAAEGFAVLPPLGGETRLAEGVGRGPIETPRETRRAGGARPPARSRP